jgi:hypothetical protein
MLRGAVDIALALMCTTAELASSVLVVALLLCVGLNIWHQSRFVSHLQQLHPGEWEKLGERARWFFSSDGDPSYGGAQWHLILCGEYKAIADPAIHRLGANARISAVLTIGVLVVFGCSLMTTGAMPTFDCLPQ